jgi:hypothetical protein
VSWFIVVLEGTIVLAYYSIVRDQCSPTIDRSGLRKITKTPYSVMVTGCEPRIWRLGHPVRFKKNMGLMKGIGVSGTPGVSYAYVLAARYNGN